MNKHLSCPTLIYIYIYMAESFMMMIFHQTCWAEAVGSGRGKEGHQHSSGKRTMWGYNFKRVSIVGEKGGNKVLGLVGHQWTVYQQMSIPSKLFDMSNIPWRKKMTSMLLHKFQVSFRGVWHLTAKGKAEEVQGWEKRGEVSVSPRVGRKRSQGQRKLQRKVRERRFWRLRERCNKSPQPC